MRRLMMNLHCCPVVFDLSIRFFFLKICILSSAILRFFTFGYLCMYKVYYETKKVLDPRRLCHCGDTNCTGYDPNILVLTRK